MEATVLVKYGLCCSVKNYTVPKKPPNEEGTVWVKLRRQESKRVSLFTKHRTPQDMHPSFLPSLSLARP
jgi:hypothetical protein